MVKMVKSRNISGKESILKANTKRSSKNEGKEAARLLNLKNFEKDKKVRKDAYDIFIKIYRTAKRY